MITDINKLQQDIKAIASYTNGEEYLKGFLRSFGMPISTIDRLKATAAYHINEGVRIGQQLFYLSSKGSNLYSDFNILKKNNITNLRTRFAILANESEVLAFDLYTEETLFTSKADLWTHVDFFFPLIGREKPVIEESIAVNISVSEKFAQFYNECRLNNPDICLPAVNELICRILFFCVIDSMGVLMKDGSRLFGFARTYTDESGRDFPTFLSGLYTAVHSKDPREVPFQFSQVNYIDSRLFLDDLHFRRSHSC